MIPQGIEKGTFRFVAQHLNRCDTARSPRLAVAETFNCNVQLLYESCELTDYILLFYVIFDCDNM